MFLRLLQAIERRLYRDGGKQVVTQLHEDVDPELTGALEQVVHVVRRDVDLRGVEEVQEREDGIVREVRHVDAHHLAGGKAGELFRQSVAVGAEDNFVGFQIILTKYKWVFIY